MGVNFYDLDFCIEKELGLDVNEIFKQKGEEFFRNKESQILLNWQKSGVIATGGGVVLRPENINYLKSSDHVVIWLNPTWNVIRSRLVNSYRPLVLSRSENELFNLWGSRQHLYEDCADYIYEGRELNQLIDLIK